MRHSNCQRQTKLKREGPPAHTGMAHTWSGIYIAIGTFSHRRNNKMSYRYVLHYKLLHSIANDVRSVRVWAKCVCIPWLHMLLFKSNIKSFCYISHARLILFIWYIYVKIPLMVTPQSLSIISIGKLQYISSSVIWKLNWLWTLLIGWFIWFANNLPRNREMSDFIRTKILSSTEKNTDRHFASQIEFFKCLICWWQSMTFSIDFHS